MADQSVLITGATDGIGKATAMKFANNGYHVIIHGRNSDKIKKVYNEIKKETDARIDHVKADFSLLEDVNKMANEIQERFDHIDILINNAGIGSGPKGENKRKVSKDGFELRFAVNYLSHFLLTNKLLPVLKKSHGESRIINLSSAAQNQLDFNNLMLENDYSGSRAYGQSKLAMAIFTAELADQLQNEDIISVCLHPGSLLDTQMVRESFGQSWGSPEEGADAIFYLATSEEVKSHNGGYFSQKKPSKADLQAADKKIRSKLWEESKKLVGIS